MSSKHAGEKISSNDTFTISSSLSTIAFSIVIVITFFIAMAPSAFSQLASNNNDDRNNAGNGTLTTTGVATMDVRPDKAVLTFAVETMAKTATEALNENNQRVNNILEALEGEVGLTENQTSTAQFMISPIYGGEIGDGDNQLDGRVVGDSAIESFPPPPDQQMGNITGYRVTNAIQVETFEISNISSIIDTAVQAGANRIDNLFFTVSEEKSVEVREQLITNAIENAREKAGTAADALNVQIVGVDSVSIQEGFVVPQTAFREATTAASATPVLPGEQEVSTAVNVTYLIEQEE